MRCVICGCSDTSAVVVTDPATGSQPTTDPASGLHHHGDGHWHAHDQDGGHAHNHEHVDGHSQPDTHDHAHDHDHTHPHRHDHDHDHAHPHRHDHDHGYDDPVQRHGKLHGRTIQLEQDLLAKNQLLAERHRGWLAGRDVLALNLVRSPGSGKTSLLERTVRETRDRLRICVIEGDQATRNDADRIRATGATALQINTGTGCHPDADMLAQALRQIDPPRGSVVMIENVGNLVCPALFDLGERAKVVILSVTEGEDKPIKYPHMFRASTLMLLNKTDLLPYLRFDVARCLAYARAVNPAIEVMLVSAQTGDGLDAWYQWLHAQLPSRDAFAQVGLLHEGAPCACC